MKKFFQTKPVKIALISLASFVVIVFALQLFGWGLFNPAYADATVYAEIVNTINTILYYLFIWPFSIIAGILSGTLVDILGSGVKYVSMPAIVRAWMVVRDVANIGFIISLLVVAFSTTLGIERYSYKKLLPRILIMAVLVNFSRTICGIFTDFATVLMKSFANAVGPGGTGSLLATFGITGWTSPDEGAVPDGDTVNDAGNIGLVIVLVIILLAVMCVTLTVWIVALILRIVTIWFLVVLSPLTFALYAIPNGEKYYSDWWKQFGQAVILGPLIAFFFWLSLYIATISNTDGAAANGGRYGIKSDNITNFGSQGGESENFASNFQITDPNTLINFIVAIMMLFTGLKISKQMSGEFGGILNKVQGMATKGVKSLAKGGLAGVAYRGANIATSGGASAGAWSLASGAFRGTRLNRVIPGGDRIQGFLMRKKAQAIANTRKAGNLGDIKAKDLSEADKGYLVNRGMKYNSETNSFDYADDVNGENAKKATEENPAAIFQHKQFKNLMKTDPSKAQELIQTQMKGMKPEDFAKLDYGKTGSISPEQQIFRDAGKAYIASSHDKRKDKLLETIEDNDLREELGGRRTPAGPGSRTASTASAAGTSSGGGSPYAPRYDDEAVAVAAGGKQALVVPIGDKAGNIAEENQVYMTDTARLQAKMGTDSIAGRAIGDNIATAIEDPTVATQVAQAMQGMIQDSLDNLAGVDMGDEDGLREALRDFHGASVDGKSLGELQQMINPAEEGAKKFMGSLDKSGEKLVAGGFSIMDKDYAGQRGKVRAHEQAHMIMTKGGVSDAALAQSFAKLNAGDRNRVIAHLQPRADYASLSEADLMREYLADNSAGLVKPENQSGDNPYYAMEQAMVKTGSKRTSARSVANGLMKTRKSAQITEKSAEKATKAAKVNYARQKKEAQVREERQRDDQYLRAEEERVNREVEAAEKKYAAEEKAAADAKRKQKEDEIRRKAAEARRLSEESVRRRK